MSQLRGRVGDHGGAPLASAGFLTDYSIWVRFNTTHSRVKQSRLGFTIRLNTIVLFVYLFICTALVFYIPVS